jgi:hypothetical protein
MSDTVVVASTTDSMEDIKAAADSGVTVETSQPEPAAEPASDPEPAKEPESPRAEVPATEVVEPEPETEEEAKPEKKGEIRERKRDLQSRIDELVRDKYTSQRAANDAQNEVLRLRAELDASTRRQPPPQEPPVEAPKVVDDPEPASDAFETFEEFTKATAKWAARTERRAIEKEAAENRKKWEAQEQDNRRAWMDQQTRQNNESLMSAHYARIDAAKADLPDFDAVIDASQDIELAPPMRAVIMNEELGPHLMYYLAQHPEECDKIAKLAPTPQLVAMGRIMTKIEAKLEAKTEPKAEPEATPDAKAVVPKKPAPVSKLPPPIKTVGSGAAASTRPLDELDYQEFARMRNEQERARRR